MTDRPPPEPAPLEVLERDRRLSASVLWPRQREYFERKGGAAWGPGEVPHRITSNPLIAERYAGQIVAFLRDCRRAGTLAEGARVHVVELGAGSGRFGYLTLRHLRRRLAGSVLADVQVTYVLTDFTDTVIDGWRRHPWLRPLLAEGTLDVARFDAAAPGDLALEASGRVLAPGTVDAPLVVVANYVFDSVPHDCFAIRDGRAFEYLVTSTAPAGDDSPAAVECSWRAAPVGALDDPDVAAIVDAYAATLGDTVVLVPVGGLACLREVEALASGQPALVVAADKGHVHPRALEGAGDPTVAAHGSVSLMVNFDAVGRYVEHRGGTVLHPPHQPPHLVVAAYVLGGPAGRRAWPETARYYADGLAEAGPDDWFTLKAALGDGEHLTLEQVLALLRLARWDPSAFMATLPRLLALAGPAPAPQRADVHLTVRRVREQFFPIGDAVDVAAGLGLVLQAIGEHAEAVDCLTQSVELRGPTARKLTHLAVSAHAAGDTAAARRHLHAALALDPGFPDARQVLAALDAETAR